MHDHENANSSEYLSCFGLQVLYAVPRPPAASLPPRETVNFDFGWRFHLGDPVGHQIVQCSDADFPTNYSNVECLGLHSLDACQCRRLQERVLQVMLCVRFGSMPHRRAAG